MGVRGVLFFERALLLVARSQGETTFPDYGLLTEGVGIGITTLAFTFPDPFHRQKACILGDVLRLQMMKRPWFFMYSLIGLYFSSVTFVYLYTPFSHSKFDPHAGLHCEFGHFAGQLLVKTSILWGMEQAYAGKLGAFERQCLSHLVDQIERMGRPWWWPRYFTADARRSTILRTSFGTGPYPRGSPCPEV